ncbi:hypothetical protein BT69DRAFT_397205 [Atractiella rhizophila]|nr:hypothetical protein BT69DRAFT_397205 [Atractiella rhizophila]
MSKGEKAKNTAAKAEEDMLVDDWETADYDSIPISMPPKDLPSATWPAIRTPPDGFGEEEGEEEAETWRRANETASSNAFAPAFKILKRAPPQPTPRINPSHDSKGQKTLEERQAEYDSARIRIFGEGSQAAAEKERDAVSGKRDKKAPGSHVTSGSDGIIREPKGPANLSDKGFKRR